MKLMVLFAEENSCTNETTGLPSHSLHLLLLSSPVLCLVSFLQKKEQVYARSTCCLLVTFYLSRYDCYVSTITTNQTKLPIPYHKKISHRKAAVNSKLHKCTLIFMSTFWLLYKQHLELSQGQQYCHNLRPRFGEFLQEDISHQ